MLYRPLPGQSLWDTFVFDEGGRYHLFFLQGPGLGHAVSEDLSTWTPLPDIDLRGAPGEWNEAGAALTGCVVAHDGKYVLLAGALTPDTRESVYGAFTSNDLISWVPHPANPVLRAPESFGHGKSPTRDWGMFDAWRDPFVVRDASGLYHAYLCARVGEWSEERTGAVIAHATSTDLIDWEHHEPLLETDRVKYTEVPGVFELDGRHYAHFLDHGWGGLRIHTPSREDSSGTYYLVASSPEGPYEWPRDPLLIGASHELIGAWAARTLAYDGGQLLYHHIAWERSAFGTFKRVRSDSDGSLHLEYFPAVESLEVGDAIVGTELWRPRSRDVGVWETTPIGVIARSRVAGSSSVLAPDLGDLHLTFTLRAESGGRAGVVLRSAAQTSDVGERVRGVTVLFDFDLQQARLEVLDYSDFEGWGPCATDFFERGAARAFDSVHVQLQTRRDYEVRCLVRAEFVEVYLDARWLFSQAMATNATRGDVELMVERGEASFSNLRIAALSPLM